MKFVEASDYPRTSNWNNWLPTIALIQFKWSFAVCMSVPGVTPERHAACTGHDLERNTQGFVTYCFHKKIMGTLAYPANFGAVALVDAFLSNLDSC